MASLNALRGLLVAGAAIAAVVSLFMGRFGVAALMLLAVGVHGLGSMWLKQRTPPGAASSPHSAEAGR